jgi:tRNA-dihydrouridine synthase
MNFWQSLPKPFFVLAPMDDVTDVVFRQVVAQAAAPDVFFTEFVSTDGLQSAGREATLERLRIEPGLTKPLVAQIWGADPEHYRRAAQDIARLGFAGIDINLGCPEKSIVARGCCGGLIGHNDRVADIIAATKAGAPNLPVSVKTRLGLHHIITEDWAGFLLGQDLAALTIHARTVREMSRVPAHWDEIAKVVALRDQLALHTTIIGNGDVANRTHGLALARQTGVDGIMIGRGIFHDIFAFAATNEAAHTGAASNPSTKPHRNLALLLHHLDLYEQWGSKKSFHTLKKFFKIYVAGWPGAADLRTRLMNANHPQAARGLVQSYLEMLPSESFAHQSAS